MNISRRTALIGLGTVAGGVGVVTAAGAFDTVEAQREFELQVAGDSAALLAFSVLNPRVAVLEEGGAGGNDIIAFELDEDLVDAGGINENAVTEFWSAFSITNNGGETVQVTIDTSGVDGVTFYGDGNDLENTGVILGPGDEVEVDIHIDTTPSGGYSNPPGGSPYEMTIIATSDY